MGTLKVSIGQFLIEAAALTTLAALIALIISAAFIRLVGSLRTAIDPPERNGPNQQTVFDELATNRSAPLD
jgi:ABC-type transport system involved in cytochrome bd biosynthesis fused ATPase/permease subunit